ncbi:MAG: glycosyltransferase [Oscillospiraceae bacterium]
MKSTTLAAFADGAITLAREPGHAALREEDYAFTEAKRIISILPDAGQHVAERGADVSKFVYIPNGVVLSADAKREPAPEQHARAIAQLKEQGKFVAMYLGGFAEANALEDLVESAPRLAENIAVVLIGEGFKKEQLMRMAKEKGYQNLVFLPGVKKTEVTAVQGLADCLYIGARRSALYRFGVGMNKLYDYMLSARPIIYGIEASNDPVSDAGCGLTIEPESAAAIAQAINALSGWTPPNSTRWAKTDMITCCRTMTMPNWQSGLQTCCRERTERHCLTCPQLRRFYKFNEKDEGNNAAEALGTTSARAAKRRGPALLRAFERAKMRAFL